MATPTDEKTLRKIEGGLVNRIMAAIFNEAASPHAAKSTSRARGEVKFFHATLTRVVATRQPRSKFSRRTLTKTTRKVVARIQNAEHAGKAVHALMQAARTEDKLAKRTGTYEAKLRAVLRRRTPKGNNRTLTLITTRGKTARNAVLQLKRAFGRSRTGERRK